MRKWHRWLAVVFGVFLFWIALTGVGTQIVILTLGDGDHDADEAPAAPDAQAGKFALITPALAHEGHERKPATPTDLQAAGAPVGFACPAGWSCLPPSLPDADDAAADEAADEALEFVQHLHSGEAFGPIGTAISLASGLALLFFAFSGLWMYVKMWRARTRGGQKRTMFW